MSATRAGTRVRIRCALGMTPADPPAH